MFGILVGAGLILLGTVAAVRHHRHGRRAVLACALKRLRATDDQKQRLTALFDDAQNRLSSTRQRVSALRAELLEVLTAASIDGQRLEGLEARLFEVMGEATLVLRESVTRVHETLDPQQRRQLAEWIRRASKHHHHCHAAGCHC